MQQNSSTVLPAAAWRLAVCAALVLAGIADADAKGGRGRSSSGTGHSSHSSSKSDHDSSSGSYIPPVTIRTNSGSSSSGSGSQTEQPLGSPAAAAAAGAAAAAAAAAPLTPEEAARRAAAMATYERVQEERLAEQRAAAERAETERLTASQIAAQQAAQRSAEQRAAAARVAAELERKKREEANVAAESDRVLLRAMTDYPLLRSAEGQAILQQIMERHRALLARGTYPSIAMTEAVADHAYQLTPRSKPLAAAAAAPAEQQRSIGSCRWVTPTQWACDPPAARP
ncbi:hypothetical protein [uncultured Ramlibacter sp.]|uniref:hypothetical protein n=1 Tax=uncultured Ramlibacter sp. TaxID=260755 RepID=UPI0026374444|nr:hypothetical protein [uncultured Ramlibacter sp.]